MQPPPPTSLDPARTETRGGAPRQTVRSPEQVTLELPIAGPSSRMIAYGIDLLLLTAIFTGMIAVILLATPALEWLQRQLEDLGQNAERGGPDAVFTSPALLILVALFLLLQFAIETGYFIFWEMVLNGRSPGKAAVGLRVVSDDGRALSFQQSLARNLLRVVDMLPNSYLVGFAAMLFSRDGKRLGDLAAGTIVIRLDRPPAALPIDVGDDAAREFRFERSQLGAIGPVERTLLRQTLRRIEGMKDQEAEPILARTTEALRRRIGYGEIEPLLRKAFLQALLRATEGM